MDMDRFVNEQNIGRYRKLLSGAITASERAKLLTLLAEEMAKFIELQKVRTNGPLGVS
jgi:hypothetical protein